MDSSRRRILQLLGISALALTTKPVLDAFAQEHQAAAEAEVVIKTGDKALKAKQWAMVVDTRKLKSEADMEPMIKVCHKIHNVPHFEDKRHEIKWIWAQYRNWRKANTNPALMCCQEKQ